MIHEVEWRISSTAKIFSDILPLYIFTRPKPELRIILVESKSLHFYFLCSIVRRLYLHNHFSEMPSTLQILQSFLGLLEREDLVYHWHNLGFFVNPEQLLESLLWSIQYSFDGHISLQSQYIDIHNLVPRLLLAREISDRGDHAAEFDAVERLRECLSTAGFKDDVSSLSVRDFEDLFMPIRRGLVVDQVVGTKLLSFLQF